MVFSVLKELLSECRDEYLKLIQNKSSMFDHRDHRGDQISTRDIRPMSTVIMDEKEKRGLWRILRNSSGPKAERGAQVPLGNGNALR
ncbi:hypothetical protein QBC33DRAFT_551999 [Phialemonium atrogriseum]|uniref:Uncharacterized protein n=1 Tax=Phialemonium atrogriseum TaxID=1093897 RepID=A0AAJ0BQU8_9PEZI|nr:uncharacterized protein QBC33DRAFT_551999 [Phialemonium atrogriseum]KAK1762362.1 hypothetical protein QBC33DRAFT_551999 [Phialemonium atrogriseum]